MIIENKSNIEFSYVLPDGSTETENKDSNIVKTEILTYLFTKVKSSNKTFVKQGENADFTVLLTNNSSATIKNQIFIDIMTDGANYLIGSVMIDGVSYPAYDLIAGFPLNDLNSGDSTTIKYTVTADNPLTQNIVTNYGNLNYSVENLNFAENTNNVDLAVISNTMSIFKQVDKKYAVSGDTLHYTNTIVNTGNQTKTNIIFRDNIPTGTTFVLGSVIVDGVNQPIYNPEVGFALPDMTQGQQRIVEFDVKVI